MMGADTVSSTVLRRRSWPIFFGIAILGLGVGVTAAVFKVTAMHGFREGWQGIPVFLAVAAVCGRIANSKVVMQGAVLLLVNPLRTYIIPKAMIRNVSVGDDGTLEVHLDEERKIASFAFGGSLIDRINRTSPKAERNIRSWLHSSPAIERTDLQVRWSRCILADLSLLLCVVTAGVGALWMALSSG
ncbi:hypothetical protein EOT10_39695 [Streptomyces antnestii]|uniref:PH domain-containing protein n=1 Tax=Streptomyces antnestii TaxID=2494256 RepID=A0A437NYK9_9ACTN|nr:hypothetical protein [Streptomyces sp. San01]RVU15112.1 hypothetical protein EOT10_39695 [Streptomyces sp. San01]